MKREKHIHEGQLQGKFQDFGGNMCPRYEKRKYRENKRGKKS